MTCSNITLSILQLPSRIFNIFVYFFIMGFRQPNLLHLSTALLALSLVGLNAQLIPQAHLGCVGYRDHFLDTYSWACAEEGLGGKITPDPESNLYQITVFTMWLTNQKNPPRLSKPLRQQTFQWDGYKGDVLVTQQGCLRTVTASGLDYERIGECPAGKYLQKTKILNPYRQKQDFLRRNPQFKTPDPITGAGHVSVPEIFSSPEISFSGQTTPPSTYETGQQVSNNRPLANGVFDDISDPLDLDLANELPTTNSALSLTNGAAVRESSQQLVAEFSSPPDNGLPSEQVYTPIDEFEKKSDQATEAQAGYQMNG